MVQPKPAESSNASLNSEAYTSSFFGMQPTLTQVPPRERSSATATRAPRLAATRLARTPAEPAPITKRSKSYFSAIEIPPIRFDPSQVASLAAHLDESIGGDSNTMNGRRVTVTRANAAGASLSARDLHVEILWSNRSSSASRPGSNFAFANRLVWVRV